MVTVADTVASLLARRFATQSDINEAMIKASTITSSGPWNFEIDVISFCMMIMC